MKNALVPAVLLTTLSGIAGCDADSTADTYAAVMPDSRIMVGMDTATARSSAGDPAAFAFFTLHATTSVNGLITWVLATVDHVTDFRPTWTDGDHTAMWGPYEDAGHHYVLFVTHDTEDGLYSWGINMKPAEAGEDAYETILAGQADEDSSEDAYSGWFAIDFDTIAALNPAETGTGTFVSSYEVDGEEVIASAAFEGFSPDGAEPADAVYHYAQTVGVEGMMDLAFTEDVTGNGEPELLLIRSRWLASREGRADVAITGGELGAVTFAATECWDTDLAVTYSVNNYALIESGDATTCAFDDASYSEDAAVE